MPTDSPDKVPDSLGDFELMVRRVSESFGVDADLIVGQARRDEDQIPEESTLIAVEARLWEHFMSARPTFADPRWPTQLIAWSWLAQAYRQMHSAFVLYQEGLPDTAVANARCAVEHGVYLSLLAGVDSAESIVDPLMRKFLSQITKISEMVPDEQSDIMGELVEKLTIQIPERSNPSGPSVTVFEQVCNRLVTGDIVYLQFRLLSDLIHTGMGIAGPYVIAAAANPGPTGLNLRHSPEFLGARRAIWMAIGGCAWAGWSIDQLFGTDYFGALLETTVRDLHFKPLVLVAPSSDVRVQDR